MRMTANRTHRTRLAKTLAKSRPMPYQKALAHVVACSDASLLPSRLDQAGMNEALVVLERHLDRAAFVPAPASDDRPTGEPATAPAKKTPLSKDPLCVALANALLPVLESTCPDGAGGYGGSLQANLSPADAEALGGVPLIRAALRSAARRLGWRVQTLGHESEHVAVVIILDKREAPAEFTAALERTAAGRTRKPRSVCLRSSTRRTRASSDPARLTARPRCSGRRWWRPSRRHRQRRSPPSRIRRHSRAAGRGRGRALLPGRHRLSMQEEELGEQK